MAKIRVFTHLENPHRDNSSQRVSKSTAIKWLTLGTHFFVDPRTIQAYDPDKRDSRLKARVRESIAQEHAAERERLALETPMPPADGCGCKFVLRRSEGNCDVSRVVRIPRDRQVFPYFRYGRESSREAVNA